MWWIIAHFPNLSSALGIMHMAIRVVAQRLFAHQFESFCICANIRWISSSLWDGVCCTHDTPSICRYAIVLIRIVTIMECGVVFFSLPSCHLLAFIYSNSFRVDFSTRTNITTAISIIFSRFFCFFWQAENTIYEHFATESLSLSVFFFSIFALSHFL